jgi:VWFA-related protein
MDPRRWSELNTPVSTVAPSAGLPTKTPRQTSGPREETEPAAGRSSREPARESAPVRRRETNPRGFRFRVNSQLVHLNVRVTGDRNEPVGGLNQADFEIFEDGHPQPIAYFQPQTAPINLLLLLDLSGSTKTKMKVIRRAAIRFVQSLSPDDRVAVAAFTSDFMIISPFTTDRKLLQKRIDDIDNEGGGTAFYDAMWYALEEMEDIQGTRKAMVVMSDGVDNVLQSGRYTTEHEFEELLKLVGTTDVTLFHIYLDTEYEQVVKERNISSRAYRVAREQIGRLAEKSGGPMFQADKVEDLEEVYALVAGELRMMYSLGYYAPPTKGHGREWRRVEVRLKDSGRKVHTRPGYYSE